MAKRLNKNLVVGLTLAGMFVTTSVAIWMLKNLRDKDPEIYVEQAKSYAEDGKPKLAMRYYLRAHRAADRQEPRYLVLAGRMALEADDSENALRFWGNAINLDPNCLDAQKGIVEFRLEQARMFPTSGYWQVLKKEAARLLEMDDSLAVAHNAQGLALLGSKRDGREPGGEGEDKLKRAVELAPDNADYVTDLALRYEFTGRADEARATYLSFLESYPDSARAKLRYAQFLARPLQDETDRARQVLTQALLDHPDDAELHVQMSKCWHQIRVKLARDSEETDSEGRTPEDLFELTRAELTKAIELDPDAYDSYLVLGGLYRQQTPPRLDEALQVYKARYERPPLSRSGFKGMLNRQNQFRLYVQVVETTLQKYDSKNPTPKQKKRNEKIVNEAEKYLALAVSEVARENRATHKLRGKIYRLQKKHREAINELEQASAEGTRPDFETLLLLADLYYKDGQLGVAYSSVKKALEVRSNHPAAWSLRAQISLALDQPQNALEWAEQGLRLDPGHGHSRLMRAQALVQLGRETEVGEDLKQLIDPDDENKKMVQEALIMQLEGRHDEAIQLILQVLEHAPAYKEAVRIAAFYYRDHDQAERAVEIVSRAVKEDPKDRALQALKVNLEIKDPEERDAKLVEIIKQGRNPANVAIQLFNFYISRKDFPKAKESLDQAEELDPRSTVVIERQYRLALMLKEYDRAEEYVDKAARLNVDGASGEFFRGRLLLERGEFQRAVEVLRGATNTYPSNSRGYVDLGAALHNTRRFEEAQEAYQTAIEFDPTNGMAHRGLAMLADMRGQEATLYTHLDACEKFLPNDPWVRQQLQLKLEKEDPQAGIAKRMKIRDDHPSNLDNLVKLAGLYLQTGDFDQAVAMAAEAHKLDQSLPTTWQVANTYTQAGRAAEAESLLKEYIAAQEQDVDKARGQLLLARHYSRVGETSEQFDLVEETYLQAATYSDAWEICSRIGTWYDQQAQELNDSRLYQKAFEWFDRARGRVDQDAVVVRAGLDRRIFDVLIASRDFERAAQEVDAYIAGDPNDPRGLLYKAEIEFQTGELDQALDGFGRYLEMQPKSSVGYYRRGTIYYVKSEWDKAIADLSQAAALEPDKFGYMHRKRLAGALEARGDVDEAINALQAILADLDLEQRSSRDAQSVAALLSEMLGRNERYEAQRGLATQYKNLLPTEPYWHNVLGQNAIVTGNLHQAAIHLKEACKLSNYAEPPVESVMIAWIQSGDYDQVVDFVTNEVPEDRRFARVHLRWAQALAAKGDRDAAMPHFITALEMARTSPEVTGTVAAVMQNSLGPEQALQIARERLKSDPDDPTTKILLASILHRTPDGQSEALEIWRELAATAATDTEKIVPLTAGAQLAHATRDFQTARNFYEQLVAYYDRIWSETQDRRVLNPLGAMLNNLAYLLAEDLNQPQLALPHAERAAEYSSDSPAVLDTLGWIQVKLGRYRDAIASLSRAIEKRQDVPDFHLHIAEAYIGEGHENAAAARELQRAYELAIAQEAAAKQAQNPAGAEALAEMQRKIERRAAELDFEVKPPPEEEQR